MTQDIRARLLQFTSQAVSVQTEELGEVFIRRLTLRELDEMQNEGKTPPAKGEIATPITVRLLARFFGDAQGKQVFDLTNPEDRDALLGFPVALAAEVLRAGNRINKMDEEKPKNV